MPYSSKGPLNSNLILLIQEGHTDGDGTGYDALNSNLILLILRSVMVGLHLTATLNSNLILLILGGQKWQ